MLLCASEKHPTRGIFVAKAFTCDLPTVLDVDDPGVWAAVFGFLIFGRSSHANEFDSAKWQSWSLFGVFRGVVGLMSCMSVFLIVLVSFAGVFLPVFLDFLVFPPFFARIAISVIIASIQRSR